MSTSGPLFDGRADAIVADMVKAIRKKVAAEGAKLVQAAFSSAIREESGGGKFLASITVTESSRTYDSSSGHKSYTLAVGVPADTDVVTTSLATYGPWLEGSGSRNSSTRFGGYHGFQLATTTLTAVAGAVAQAAAAPYVELLNE